MYSDPMQNPQQNPQFYGNQPPPKKSGPGCWLWVPLGCLAFLIVIGIIVAVSVKTAMNSAGGVFGGAMKGGMDIADATNKIKVINTAVNQYHQDKGSYPASLEQLVPKYLPSSSALHATGDINANPTHDSFTYQKPSNNAESNTPYLSTTVSYTMKVATTSVTTNEKVLMSLDGTQTQQQTQTQSTAPAPGSGN